MRVILLQLSGPISLSSAVRVYTKSTGLGRFWDRVFILLWWHHPHVCPRLWHYGNQSIFCTDNSNVGQADMYTERFIDSSVLFFSVPRWNLMAAWKVLPEMHVPVILEYVTFFSTYTDNVPNYPEKIIRIKLWHWGKSIILMKLFC